MVKDDYKDDGQNKNIEGYINQKMINDITTLIDNSEKFYNQDIENIFRLKDLERKFFPNGDSGDPESPNNPTADEPRSTDPRQILEPLDDVILNSELKDDIVERCGLAELVEGKPVTDYSGVILFGPPGTGKSVMLDAVKQCYDRAGAYTKKVSASEIVSKYLGDSAKKMREVLDNAVKQAESRGLPSFIYIDEGEVIVQKANPDSGNEGIAKAYQSVINVLKEYIGNHRNVVIGITTNTLPDSLEDAMTRSGRMTTYFVDYPEEEQVGELWQYFSAKNTGLELTTEQSIELAQLTGKTSGAFIEEFTRTYKTTLKRKMLHENGYSSLIDALKDGYRPAEEEIAARVTYDNIVSDVRDALSREGERNGKPKGDNGARKPLGFRPSS